MKRETKNPESRNIASSERITLAKVYYVLRFTVRHLTSKYLRPMHTPVMAIGFWQQIGNWDRSLFLWFNHAPVNTFFDTVLPFVRDSVFWAPLYLFLLVFVVLNFGKQGLWWAIAFLATVAIADLIGTYGFKQIVQRLRPCNDPELYGQVRLIVKGCSGGYSFVSNHAANHFGLATFMALSFRPIFSKWTYAIYAWAVLIAFAQLYVGVHYPLDVLAGAGLGTAAGYLTASVYRHNFGQLALLT